MRYKSWFPALFVLIVLCLQAFVTNDNADGQKIIFREDNWRVIGKEALAKKKMIFVFIGADYCSACRRMESILRSPKLGDFYNSNFISVHFHGEDIIQHQRATAWGISVVPSMVFLNEHRKVIHVFSGYRDVEGMLQEAQTAMEKSQQPALIVDQK